MTKNKPNYSEYLELLTVLIIHMGSRLQDDATAAELAEHLGFREKDVTEVLERFYAIFRRSQHQQQSAGHEGAYYRYSLLRRYARRIYKNGVLTERSGPLSNEEISSILSVYIENRIKGEQEEWHHKITTWVTMAAALIAAFASIISALMS